jgi:protein transport protein SEC31
VFACSLLFDRLFQAVSALPPGWVTIQDPSSGQIYYANQNTGESSWDPPIAAAPAPELAVQPTNPSFGANDSTALKVASKYGDGFVTSASNPQLAEQYGNVGTRYVTQTFIASLLALVQFPLQLLSNPFLLLLKTLSNPYTNANRPGTAAAAVGATPKKSPVSGTLDPNALLALSQEDKELQNGLMAIANQLIASANGSMEQKQASESQKAVAVFIKTVARGGVGADIVNKVRFILYSLQNRDYASASAIITGLVSNEWKDHKDWLKGLKFLVQMASKKQL